MDRHSDDQDKKTDWAEWRTDWAEDRTVLANERTFAGWMRTGMAAVAIAIGLRAVFDEAEPAWVPKAVATAFLATAIVIFWAARRQSGRAQDRLETHDTEAQPTRLFTILAGSLSVCAVLVGWVLWTL
jgi:putative membrane protein